MGRTAEGGRRKMRSAGATRLSSGRVSRDLEQRKWTQRCHSKRGSTDMGGLGLRRALRRLHLDRGGAPAPLQTVFTCM
eukprot:7100607-Pyramimonas_sp.AAC.1